MLSDSALQDRLVAAFRSSIGLAFPDPAYEKWTFPTDRDPWRHYAARDMWACALEIRAACYHAGVTEPEVSWPYEQHVGMIGALVGNMLMRAGAWHWLDTPEVVEEWWDAPGIPFNQPFDVGWGFVMGDNYNQSYGGVEHYFAAVGLDAVGSSLSDYTITSVEGGRVNAKGFKCIQEVKRSLVKMGDGTIWALEADKPGSHGRRVKAVYALPFLASAVTLWRIAISSLGRLATAPFRPVTRESVVPISLLVRSVRGEAFSLSRNWDKW